MTTPDQLDISIDVDTMTIGELEEIENITGIAFGNIDWEHMTARLMRALVYVSVHRNNQDFTIEDAGNVRVSALSKPKEEEAAVTELDPMLSLNGSGAR